MTDRADPAASLAGKGQRMPEDSAVILCRRNRNKGRRLGFGREIRSAARACRGQSSTLEQVRAPGRVSTPRQRAAALGGVGREHCPLRAGRVTATGIIRRKKLQAAPRSSSRLSKHCEISPRIRDRPQRWQ